MRKWILSAALLLLLAACQPTDDTTLPTLAVLPSATTTFTPTETETPLIPTETATATATSTVTLTATASPTPTETFTPTWTYTPSITPVPSNTVDPTRAFVATSTAEIIEAPQFTTFTPLPPGAIALVRPTSTGTPEIGADVQINERQFQEELDTLLRGNTSIGRTVVDFVDGGIDLELTASNGSVFVTGKFLIRFEISEGGFNNVLIARPASPEEFRMLDGAQATDAYIETAYSIATPAVFESFDNILRQRLGDSAAQRNVENITINDTTMNVFLIIPQP